VDLDTFADLVAEALESLPEEFQERLENVQVDIEDWPTGDDLESVGLARHNRGGLLGLYRGVPITERGAEYFALPDHIVIYRRPILAAVGNDEDAIREQVRKTVIHEIGHYYGIDDDRLEELGW